MTTVGTTRRTSPTKPKLELDPVVIRKARSLARKAGAPVVKIAKTHTTVSVERAVLRLAGLSGADHEGEPWVNHLVDAVRGEVGLELGVTTPVFDALRRGEAPDLLTLAQKATAGSVSFRLPQGREASAAQRLALRSVKPRDGPDRQEPRHPGPPDQATWQPEAAAVDLPDRGDR